MVANIGASLIRAALSHSRFSKVLSYFGLIVGAAGVITVIPTLGDSGAVFGLGSIAWFLCIEKMPLLADVSKLMSLSILVKNVSL